jgi:hypothetical protein
MKWLVGISVCMLLASASKVCAESIAVNFETCHEFLTEDWLATGAAYEENHICWIDSSMVDVEYDLDYDRWTMIQEDGVTNWPVVIIARNNALAIVADFSWDNSRQLLFHWDQDGSESAGGGTYDPSLKPVKQIRSGERPRAIFAAAVAGAVRCAAHPGCRAVAIRVGRLALKAGAFAAAAISSGIIDRWFAGRVERALFEPQNYVDSGNSQSGSAEAAAGSPGGGSHTVTGPSGTVEIIEVPLAQPSANKRKRAVVIYRDTHGNVIGRHEYVL